MLKFRKRWTRQPQRVVGISKLAQGFGCVSATLTSRGSFDAARQRAPRSVDSGVTYVTTPFGVAQRGTTTADGVAVHGAGFPSLFPVAPRAFTVMLLVNIATTGARRIICGDYDSGGLNASFSMEQDSSNRWKFEVVSTAPAAFSVQSTGIVSTGWKWLEFTWDGAFLYGSVDGAQFDTKTFSATLRAGVDYRIGRAGALGSLGFNGDIAAHFIFGKFLSAAERAAIRGNPWQLFAPQDIWVSESTTPTGYTLTADAGSFSLTGNAAGLRVSRRLVAAHGSFAWTANSANVLRSQRLLAAAAAYTLTGNAAALKAARLVSAAAGSFTWTGNAATLSKSNSYSLAADAGAYAWSGVAAGLRVDRRLAAAAGSYSFTGNAATLTYTPLGAFSLTADAGAYSLTGGAAGLRVGRRLPAEAGIFNMTGSAAQLLRGYRLAAVAQAYVWTGGDATLTKSQSYSLEAAAGVYAWTGNAASLIYSGAPAVVRYASRSRIFTTGRELRAILTERTIRSITP